MSMLGDLGQSLLDAMPTPAYLCDTQGRIVARNAAAGEWLGAALRVGMDGETFLRPAQPWRQDGADATTETPLALARSTDEAVRDVEVMVDAGSGGQPSARVNVVPLTDGHSATRAFLCSFRITRPQDNPSELPGQGAAGREVRSLQKRNDTLEQRLLERTHLAESASQDLHYSERNFALLVGSIVDYAIYMLDPNGVITNWNGGAERIKGYLAEEVVGSHFSCFYTPEDRARGKPADALAIARREGRYSAEGWRVRKDGTRFWASVVIDPVIDHGEVIGFAKVTRDVTERMESEAALIESERRARGVIDTALDGFVQLDETGRVVEWNPRATEMFGWSRENAMGKMLTSLIVAEADRARFAGWLPSDSSNKARADHGQIDAVDCDGNRIPVELSISTLASKSGQSTNVFIRDLSEKIAIEAQLRQAQKMEAIGQLTGGLAHDFNNLLQGIIGSLDIIQMRADEGRTADIARFIAGALTSANRAAAMTHRLLAFSRQQPLDPRLVDANPLLMSMEELIRRTIGERIQVELEPAQDLWLTLCDPNELESAVLNLSINARDAMPDGGRLIIRSRNIDVDEVKAARWQDAAAGQYVCIEVTDTGVGMPPKVVERAFDPFFTTKPQGRGTGLGLSMVYGFARQSNGHCDIRSTPGKGTTVRLYLPRCAVDTRPDAVQESASAQPAAETGGGEVVLVVEDEIVVRHIVVEVLRQLGYTALEAAHADAALDLLRDSGPIDLLVSDIGLPGMNGRQLADVALNLRPGLKILLMTGYASGAAVADGFLAPGMELITKPFTVGALAQRLREMIETVRL